MEDLDTLKNPAKPALRGTTSTPQQQKDRPELDMRADLERLTFNRTPTEAFHDFIRSERFPCVGAKAALVRSLITVIEAGDIASPAHDVEIYTAIKTFRDNLERDTPTVQSFAVIYPESALLTEQEFETVLWRRLQCLHNFDAVAGEPWALETKPEPDSPHFSMSIAGEAFFIVGLHPNASRPARCFRYPVMVFNSHDQFERMREDGRFDKMKVVIRKRDAELSGSENPVLDDFGNTSEARQYSGRKTEDGWVAPFDPKIEEPN